jgi:hypothetical protein
LEGNQDNKDKQDEKKQDISVYLDFIKIQLDRNSKRKEILENKGYILGSVLSFIISISISIEKKDIFNFHLLQNPSCKDILKIILFSLAFWNIYNTIKPSENLFFDGEGVEIEDVFSLSMKQQQGYVLDNYLKTIRMLHINNEKKAKNLTEAIKYSFMFFIVWYIYN